MEKHSVDHDDRKDRTVEHENPTFFIGDIHGNLYAMLNILDMMQHPISRLRPFVLRVNKAPRKPPAGQHDACGRDRYPHEITDSSLDLNPRFLQRHRSVRLVFCGDLLDDKRGGAFHACVTEHQEPQVLTLLRVLLNLSKTSRGRLDLRVLIGNHDLDLCLTAMHKSYEPVYCQYRRNNLCGNPEWAANVHQTFHDLGAAIMYADAETRVIACHGGLSRAVVQRMAIDNVFLDRCLDRDILAPDGLSSTEAAGVTPKTRFLLELMHDKGSPVRMRHYTDASSDAPPTEKDLHALVKTPLLRFVPEALVNGHSRTTNIVAHRFRAGVELALDRYFVDVSSAFMKDGAKSLLPNVKALALWRDYNLEETRGATVGSVLTDVPYNIHSAENNPEVEYSGLALTGNRPHHTSKLEVCRNGGGPGNHTEFLVSTTWTPLTKNEVSALIKRAHKFRRCAFLYFYLARECVQKEVRAVLRHGKGSAKEFLARSNAEQCNERLLEAASKLDLLDPNKAYRGIVFDLYKNKNTNFVGRLKVFPKFLHLQLANSTNYSLRLPGSLKSSGEEQQGIHWETFWEKKTREGNKKVLRVSYTAQQALQGCCRTISSVRVESGSWEEEEKKSFNTKHSWGNESYDYDGDLLLFCSHLHAIHYDARCASERKNLIVKQLNYPLKLAEESSSSS